MNSSPLADNPLCLAAGIKTTHHVLKSVTRQLQSLRLRLALGYPQPYPIGG